MIAALILGSLRWFLVGACWTRPDAAGSDTWSGTFGLAARSVAYALPIHLAVTIGLAALGLYHVPLELGLLAVLCVLGLWRNRPSARHALRLLPGLAAMNLLILLVLLAPNRIEWLVGGWDPGTYINEGVSLAHEGGWTREPEPFHQFLTPEQRLDFTRERYGFVEYMPVTPLDKEHLRTEPFFFPLYPAMVASAYTAGGILLATRVNLLLGGVVLLLFAAALGRIDWRFGLAGAITLALQPLLLYHLNFPTSEILHLFLLGGILLCLVSTRVDRAGRETRRDRLPFLALLFFLGPFNRIDFLLFGAMLLVGLALADACRDAEKNDTASGWFELLVLSAAMAAGMFLSLHLSEAAVNRLGKDVSSIVIVGSAGLIGAGVARLVAPTFRTYFGGLWRWGAAHLHWGLAAVVLLGVAYVYSLQAGKVDQPMIWQLKGMWWYLTWPAVALASLGFLSLEARRLPPAVAAWVLAIAGMTVLVFVFGKIHQTWPWAARRYVPTTLPLFALLGAWGVWRTKWFGWVALAIACGFNAPKLTEAWRVMDDESRLSEHFAAVAAQLNPEDLVVCDHFVWGVPMRFLHDVHVVNGEQFYADTRKFPDQLAALQSWPGRILWLTSTEAGLGVMPEPVPGAKKIWEGEPFAFRKVRRATFVGGFTEQQRDLYQDVLDHFVAGYVQESSTKQFALWSMEAGPFPELRAGGAMVNVGDESARPMLKRGWSRPEGAWSKEPRKWHDHQWIKKSEADIVVQLQKEGEDWAFTEDWNFFVRAMPIYDKRLRQSFALYVNGTFVKDWVCPEKDHWDTYFAKVPGDLIQNGENTLTLRVGHLVKGPLKDQRVLGLLVDRVLINPVLGDP